MGQFWVKRWEMLRDLKHSSVLSLSEIRGKTMAEPLNLDIDVASSISWTSGNECCKNIGNISEHCDMALEQVWKKMLFNSLESFVVKEIYRRLYSEAIDVDCLLTSGWIQLTIFWFRMEFVFLLWLWWWPQKMHWFGLELLAVLGALCVWLGLAVMKSFFLEIKLSSFVYQPLLFLNSLVIQYCRNALLWILY